MFYIFRLFLSTGEFTVRRYGSLNAEVREVLTAEGIERFKQRYLEAMNLPALLGGYQFPECLQYTQRL